ncbi:MAG: hypothetical protein HY908_34200, partial [Myxococcales bacterium]|nr:hypothetical protein [Myxococcales bacterium]
MRSSVAAPLACLCCALAATASAVVVQPNGTVMPVDSANGEVQLYTLFANRGEAIDYQADGASSPSTFSPLCDFTAELVLNETASSLGVGWYNVDPNAVQPPALADIHVIVPAGSPVGTVISSADIKNDPAYLGGFIGFALVGWQTHYSEPQWNPICTGCNPPGPWITTVIYASVVEPDAFYLAFEDGPVGANPGDFNNDGDYNDYVYLFRGLTCQGGGQPCDTGQPGVCGPGVTQCTAQGIECHGLVPGAPAETCDGLDNDCNAATDEGDLCPLGTVCDKGTCVEACGSGEFVCPPDKACDDGYCVDPPCVNVSCPSGEVCVAGDCRAPCDGVSCPYPTVCRVGVCVDPCAGVTCDAGRVCDAGVCQAACTCTPCGAGLACYAGSGLCVEALCLGVPCPQGTHCVAGACVDSCLGATCPAGQICTDGLCVEAPPGTGGAGGSGVGGWPGTGGAGASAGGGVGASAGGGAA